MVDVADAIHNNGPLNTKVYTKQNLTFFFPCSCANWPLGDVIGPRQCADGGRSFAKAGILPTNRARSPLDARVGVLAALDARSLRLLNAARSPISPFVKHSQCLGAVGGFVFLNAPVEYV